MSDKSIYIDCYKMEGERAISLFEQWKTEVKSKRDEIFQIMLDETGAIAWRERTNWGSNATVVSDLVFSSKSDTASMSHIKINDRSRYDGEVVVCVRGKLNSKAGILFNEPIDKANESLKSLPDFSDWIISMYSLSRTGLGHSTGRGTAMLRSSAGYYLLSRGYCINDSK